MQIEPQSNPSSPALIDPPAASAPSEPPPAETLGVARATHTATELLRVALICATVCVALMLTFTQSKKQTNSSSRIATMDSLVHDGTYVINKSYYAKTIDRVMIGKDSYSSKPPLFSTIGAGVYWVIHHTTHLTLRDKHQRETVVYSLTLILAGIPHLILLGYAYALLRWFAPSVAAASWTLACLALGQLGLAYSVTINNHVPAALAAFIAFYYAYGLRHGHLTKPRHWMLAGLAIGVAPTMDLGAVFLSAGIGLYLLSFDWRSTFKYLIPVALIPVAVNFGLTWYVMGSPTPVYLRKELYDYPGSYWKNPGGIDGLDEPRLIYLRNILIGHHGLFSMTPVLCFSVVAIARTLIKRDAKYLAEALTIGIPTLILIVFYTATTKNYGGVCVGFRWFLPVVPLLLLFVAVSFSHFRRRSILALFLVCMTVGQYHVFDGIQNPWKTSNWHAFLGKAPGPGKPKPPAAAPSAPR
ncbi:MAG: hypothetical protein ABW321_07545 [Polyangiales bacterium]